MADLMGQTDMDDDSAETWLPVVGWEGLYQVSDLGRVRSLPRMTATGVRGGRVLKLHDVNGYWNVCLSAPGRRRSHRKVHQLVCEAFYGPCPPGEEVRHLDGVPHNNLVGNLKYGTRSQNGYDRVRHGTHPQARRTHCPQGHEYTPENIYWCGPEGKRRRSCKTCIQEKARARYETHRDGPGPRMVHYKTLKTHCPQGHPYEGDNLYIAPKGDRMCRECMRARTREWRARRRAA